MKVPRPASLNYYSCNFGIIKTSLYSTGSNTLLPFPHLCRERRIYHYFIMTSESTASVPAIAANVVPPPCCHSPFSCTCSPILHPAVLQTKKSSRMTLLVCELEGLNEQKDSRSYTHTHTLLSLSARSLHIYMTAGFPTGGKYFRGWSCE